MTSDPINWHSGKLYSWNASSIPAGYRQGDGVFETIRTYFGKPFRLEDHVIRLLSGARAIGLRDLPEHETILDAIESTLEENRSGIIEGEWIIRPTFFSDGSGWGFVVPVESWKPPAAMGENNPISVGISSYVHPGRCLIPPSAGCQIKWLSRGPLAHALRDARERGWEEALLLDSDNMVIEGTRSNIIVLEEKSLISPGVRSGGFPGITRDVVAVLAQRRGMEIIDRPVSLQEILNSKGLLITSSLLGIAPVKTLVIGHKAYEKPLDEISGFLISDFEHEVTRECQS